MAGFFVTIGDVKGDAVDIVGADAADECVDSCVFGVGFECQQQFAPTACACGIGVEPDGMFRRSGVSDACAKGAVCGEAQNRFCFTDQIGPRFDGIRDVGGGFGHGIECGGGVFDVVIPDRRNCGGIGSGGRANFHEGIFDVNGGRVNRLTVWGYAR